MNKLFECNKRTGIEGSICDNCGTNHTITEELLKKKVINRMKELSSEIGAIMKSSELYRKSREGISKGQNHVSLKEKGAVIRELEYLFDITEDDLK